jgi:hypothetical protein
MAYPSKSVHTVPSGKDVEAAYVSSVRYPSGSKAQRDRIEEIGWLDNDVVKSVGAEAPAPAPVAKRKHPKHPVSPVTCNRN